MKWFVIKATNSGKKNFNMGLDREIRSPKSYCYSKLYLFLPGYEAIPSVLRNSEERHK